MVEGADQMGVDSLTDSHSGSPVSNTPNWEAEQRHRRSRSEIASSFYRRSSSTINFQKWKSQMQRALQWRSRSFRDDRVYCSFDPEIMANQKRQWCKLQSKTLDPDRFKEPTSLFEHFVITGLRPDVNLERPTFPIMEPQVLFMYPPGKEMALRLQDLAAFCFPGGVKAGVLERTSSLTELNELIYGQEHLCRDDLSFIFSLKVLSSSVSVADNATLYGVCLHVQEFVHKPTAISVVSSPLPQSNSASSRSLVSAPRCYCLLTKVPFFELHYEMLNSIIAQERLHRITQFVNEMSLSDYVPSPTISKDGNTNGNADSPNWELSSPGSATASDTSDTSHAKELDKDGDKSIFSFDVRTPENSEKQSDSLEQMYGVNCNDCTSEVGPRICKRDPSWETLRSIRTSFSSARSMVSEDEDDEIFYNNYKDPTDDVTIELASENKNDLLQIISGYYSVPLLARGSKIVFQPLEHLPPIEYLRPSVSDVGVCGKYLDLKLQDPNEVSQVKLKLAAAEEAHSLSLWSTATICRVLSLPSGVLSAVVLSLIPIIRPFEWQSLFLPILPVKMLDFVDAPVPFVVKTCNLPQLPRHKELMSELRPSHAVLSREESISQKPVYKCNKVQAEAAGEFLAVMRRYLESLCSDLWSHTITSVESNNDRVSILLKDSFIDSFPARDQPFVKLFVETQLFTVLSDSRLSSFENEHN
ncbi:hypothetical protein MIMGU_mgv1a002219mg [Erythranthe guttata]|uniref:UDENN domain-containing protein n=1 Tax=Erythranthe guttata TaxID=4155 RepID=A0A022S0S6_ERYGU|nr:hypothetical protein MIMGU_mgv1a002219mg [Erythranthe guttata]